MCQAIQCSRCGKATWAGCGAHVDQVLGHLPKSDLCRCDSDTPSGPSRR